MYKNKKIIFFSHVLVWLVLFSMPYLLSYGQEQDINRVIAHFWIPLAFYAIIFYLNYFVLIDTYLFSDKTKHFIIINVIMIGLFITFKELIESFYFEEILSKTSKKEGSGPPLKMFIYIQMLSYMAPLLRQIL